MRNSISILMAGWLFTVTAFGWCCHPASECARFGQQAEASAVAATTCCDNCKHEASPQDSPSAPCECDSDCMGICKSVPATKVQLDSQQVLRYDIALVGCEAKGIAAGLLPFFSARVSVLGSEPPLRLHLFHQILLI